MKWLGYLAVLCAVVACKKPEDRSCWKFVGDQTIQERSVGEFDRLLINSKMEVVLIQDSMDKVVIHGGENLVNLIETNVEGGLLTLKNTNECQFLRNYDKSKIVVEVHFTDIYNIEFYGSEALRNEGVLKLGYFTLSIVDGAGPVYLYVDAESLNAVISHGFGDFTLAGKANYANFIVKSNGYFNTLDLMIEDSADVVTDTPVESAMNFSNAKMRVEINGSGNIKYIGYPSSLLFHEYGTGNLVDIN